MPLTPDSKYTANGVTVKVYDLTKHNDYDIDLPGKRSETIGITIHNTATISVSGTTMAEQYTRACRNGNMGDVVVHFYVDDVEAWQNLPLDQAGWHAADGNGPGNRKTIAIECIMDGSGSAKSTKAEDNCARLAAYLLHKYNFTIKDMYTHQHWYSPKYCPAYILPHYERFKKTVEKYLNQLKGGKTTTTTTTLYRVRKTWADEKSQIGAYSTLENAKKACKAGYSVFDSAGKKVYSAGSSVAATPKSINVTYRTYTNGRWLPIVTNCNDADSNGYAGIDGFAITALAAKASEGTLRYRAHTTSGGWLGWISKMNIGDWYNGYAGVQNADIDGIQVELVGVPGYEAKYRVSTKNSTKYLDWVTGLEDYAGIYGKPIDKIQIKIVKK